MAIHRFVLLVSLSLVLFGLETAVSQRQQQSQVPCLYIFGDSLVDNGNNNSLSLVLFGLETAVSQRQQQSQVPCLYIFGDSLVDNGNNNRIRGQALLRGANFASGAAGIRDETGDNLGAHTSMNQQVNSYTNAVQQMLQYFRGDTNELQRYLSRCIFYSGMGSNDYLNNYFMPDFYSTSSDFNDKTYAESLIKNYTQQLTRLYQFGARKVIVTAVGQIGCIPYELARYNNRNNSTGRCNDKINNAIVLFNSQLKKLVDRFNNGQLQGAKFVYLDTYKSTSDLAANGAAYGFEVVDKGCCGVGRNNGQITCLPLQQPCSDRTKYLFWDAFHPTETANILLAKSNFNSRAYAYPINIQELANL
ncbi:unnamed protein product [Eruca vesicaria subsp. sativa]|uniref:GDSL esterase/lipase n=1 Tax=Eruca vesicaria subsp. sativa TaxID=29727 RepID=A0ABC8JIY3_ERUVS|nr:unnamed protein product [Eruca vesicaria subsp. sativa]